MQTYYVGYEQNKDHYLLYTIYGEAVRLLRRVEFKHDTKLSCMTATVKKLPKSANIVFFDIHTVNQKIPSEVRAQMEGYLKQLNEMSLKAEQEEKYKQEQEELQKVADKIRSEIKADELELEKARESLQEKTQAYQEKLKLQVEKEVKEDTRKLNKLAEEIEASRLSLQEKTEKYREKLKEELEHKIKQDAKKVDDLAAEIKTKVEADWLAVDEIDKKLFQLKRDYERKREALRNQQADINNTIKNTIAEHGVIVKKGRFFHRAMLVKNFRVLLKTKFKLMIKKFSVDKIKEMAADLEPQHKKLLKSCIKITSVQIDPEFYEKEIRPNLSHHLRKTYVVENKTVDQNQVKEILPQIPYKTRYQFWDFNPQVDEEGNHHYELHTKTYTAKDPGCPECGGKFIKNTAVCKDCGLDAYETEWKKHG